MAILTLTSADAGKTIPVSGSLDWEIVGTDAAETIEVAAGTVATVKAGGGKDVIKLLGGAADYSVALEGSNAVFTHTVTGKKVFVPMTTAGDSVAFGNGAAVDLKIDAGAFKLGTQTLTTTSAAVTGATGTATGGSTGGSTAGQSFSLTTTVETKTLTAGNDTVDGSTTLDSVSGDTVIDSSATDADVANLQVSGAINPANMLNIETVNATGKYGSVSLDGTRFTGTKTFNFDSAIGSGAATLTGNAATAVTAGNNISSISVTNGTAGATVALNGGSATSVTATGAAGADNFTITMAAGTNSLTIDGNAGTDAYTVNLKGGSLALTGDSVDNDTLALNVSTGAQTVTVATGLAKSTTVAGDQNVTLKGDESMFDGLTVTNSLAAGKTLDLVITTASNATDLSKVAASTIELQKFDTSAKFAAGANVKLSDATTSGGLNGTTSLNVDLLKATTGTLTTDVATVNFTANTVDVTSLNATLGADAAVTVAGTKAVTLATTYTAKSVDATNLSGKLTASALGEANRVNITGGSGNDSFTFGSTIAADTTVNGGLGNDEFSIAAATNFKLTIDGGAGTNTLKVTNDTNFRVGDGDVTYGEAADLSQTSILTGITNIDIANMKTLTLTQKQLFTNASSSGINTFTLSNTGTLAIVDDNLSSEVFDLSGIQFTPGDATKVTIDVTGATAATVNGTAAGDSITGGAGADTINGGAGSDTITGGAGADVIDVGTGAADTIKMTVTGQSFAGASITSGTTALTGIDKVTGMAAGDIVDLSGILNTFTGAAGTTIAAATGTTVSLVRGNFVDATSVFTADAAGTATLVVYDADGAGIGTALEAILLVGTAGVTGTAAAGVLTLA